ncbi:MAG: pyridoxal phosphate-dependent aminotransferase [bacterium]
MTTTTPSRRPSCSDPTGGFVAAPVDAAVLRARAYNLRWAEQPPDVIPLTAADHDLPCAPVIREAVARYVADGCLAYGPAAGLPGFRAAVADYLVERRGLPAAPAQILAADGAASALFLVARALLAPGDEVVVFDPVDFLFAASTEAAGGVARRVPFSREGGIDLDALAAAIGPRTRAIALCNPHNPFGRCLRPAELEAVAALAERHDLWIISDEIWADISYAGRCPSVAALGAEADRRTIVVGGFSKSFGLAGLRIGFARAPDAAVFARLVAAGHADKTAYGAATLSQVAAEAALRDGWPWFDAFLAHLRAMRGLVCDRLDALPGLACPRPEATFLAFARILDPAVSAEALAQRLLDRARVAVVPGAARWFGPGAVGHVRLAFATARPIVEAALDRIEAALADGIGGD